MGHKEKNHMSTNRTATNRKAVKNKVAGDPQRSCEFDVDRWNALNRVLVAEYVRLTGSDPTAE
jgi:hypothetical protein